MTKTSEHTVNRNQSQYASYKEAENIIGQHPTGELFGSHLNSEDCPTDSGIPHRSMDHSLANRHLTIAQLQSALIKHHASPAMIAQDRRKIENLRTLGFPVEDTRRFPTSDKTRKGNLAEVFLAEYICAASGANLPVYRLRYNPNVEQSMKGDDVLVFDFTSARTRIIIGESKFRGTPTKEAIQEIVSGLVKSHQAGLPVSLQFVADRLYEQNDTKLANRVIDCSIKMAQGDLDLSYVGFLLSNARSRPQVNRHTTADLRNLVMVSLSVEAPDSLVTDCFRKIEESVYGNPN